MVSAKFFTPHPMAYQAIKKHVNPALQFLGILPVLFEAKRVQKGMLAFVEQDAKTSPLLLRHEDNTVARIPRVQAMEEAQNNGVFIGDMRSSPGVRRGLRSSPYSI